MTEEHPYDEAARRADPLILDLGRFDPTTKAGRQGLKNAVRGKKGGKKKPKEKPPEIPVLPKRDLEPTGDEVRRGVSERARAAANLAVELMPYDEIAVICGYPDAKSAEKAALSVMAVLHPPEDYETVQIKARALAARRLRMSTAMAEAEYLVDDGSDKRIPNTERLRWASQAGVDLMNWVTIAGAKAPTKIELTPGDEKVTELVQMILDRAGHEEILDADVIEMEYEPPPAIEAPVDAEEVDDADEEIG